MTAADVLPLARLLLAGVFLLAGVSKLLDLAGSRRALTGFGVPPALVPALGVALPLAELAVALALIPRDAAVYGAIGALLLLLFFVGGITVSLARGRTPDCHCFGQLYSEPIGRPTLVRNGLLAVVAAFVASAGWSDPGASLVAWIVPLTAAQRAAVVGGLLGLSLLTAQVALLVSLVRQNRQLLQRLGDATVAPAGAPAAATVPAPSLGPAAAAPPPITAPASAGRPIGKAAPAFALPSLDGETVSLDSLRAAGRPIVLIFSDPACGPCSALLPEIGGWQEAHGQALTIALVSRGSADANRAKTAVHRLSRVLLQRDREVAEAYHVFGTPSAVLITAEGTIGTLLAQGEAEIRQLIAQQTAAVAAAAVPASPSFDPAPGFTLPDLDGRPISLAQFTSGYTLLLFWSPTCGHCQRMLADLKLWEARPQTHRMTLLVVATGSVEDNRAMNFESPVLLDPAFTVGPLYGVTGTPSAVIVGADGRLASSLVVGGSAVLALAGQPETPHDAAAEIGAHRTFGGVRPAPLVSFPADAKPLRQDCVHDELLADGSLVLYNGCRGEVLTLNATAALIWECCTGEQGLDSIIAEVRDVFPGALDAARDVRQLLDKLLQAGMVAPATAGVGAAPGTVA